MKVKCATQNERINVLTINHSLAPLPKEERMRVLNVDEMESSFDIYLKDVLCGCPSKKAINPWHQ
jgi:hypothetical protein